MELYDQRDSQDMQLPYPPHHLPEVGPLFLNVIFKWNMPLNDVSIYRL